MAKRGARTVNIDFLREPDRERDLSDLFAGAVAESHPITQISPERLHDNPYQPRLRLDPAGLEELAAVIHSHGFQGVLVARPHPKMAGIYQIAFGHRRREAAKLAGLDVLPVIVRDLAEEEMVELAIAENIQRQDLTALEEGRTFDMMVKVLGYTYEQIAAALGKTRGYVENRLRVAWAPQDVQDLVEAKPDSLRAVATLIKIENSELRSEIIAKLLTGELTADDLPGYVEASREAGTGGTTRRGAPDEGLSTSVLSGAPAELDAAVNLSAGAASLSPASGDTKEDAQHHPTGGTSAATDSEDYSAAGDGEMDGRARQRTGYAQLSTALRAATKFQAAAGGRNEISTREFIVLADLRKLVDELYERYSPPDITAR